MLAAGDRVKLVDFGVARLVDVDTELTADQVGTPAYMAPEQTRGGAIDECTDLYALGATLYELVMRERLSGFEALAPDAIGKLEAACRRHPRLAAVITGCLHANPSARFSSARAALTELHGGTPWRKLRIGWIGVAAAAVAAIAIGSYAGYAVGQRNEPSRDPRVEKAFVLAQRGENEKALPTLPVNEPQPESPRSRMAPLGAATWILQQHVHGVDASSVYATYPAPEVRAWGLALAAEARGDRATAIAQLREALQVPAKGDVRMLVAHRLVKLLHESGDQRGAAAACDDVIRPRFYVNHRAVLPPDCVTWSGAGPSR